MQDFLGEVRFDGVAAPGIEVEIREGGEVLATTTADSDGVWVVDLVELPIGRHRIHAIAGGNQSRSINVEITGVEDSRRPAIRGVPKTLSMIEADDEATDDDSEFDIDSYNESLKVDHTWRYKKIVEARANGVDIPHDLGAEILAKAGKSLAQFNNDVSEFRDVLAELGND